MQGVMRCWGPLVAVFGLLAAARGEEEGLRVRTDFPGGGSVTAEVTDSAGQELVAEAGGGWWALRVEGVDPERPLNLVVRTKRAKQQHPFVYSRADGEWRVVAAGEALDEAGAEVRYALEGAARSCTVARYRPYGSAEAKARLAEVDEALEGSELFALGPSRGGRAVPGIRIKHPGVADEERVGVWIQARQHAWEITGSYAADGFLAWLLEGGPESSELLRISEIVVVPVMDPDGVAEGKAWMSGPNPNREWLNDRPAVYPQVERAKAMIREFGAAGRGLGVFVDLHCYTVTAERDDWQYWATGFKDWEPDEASLAVLRAVNAAVEAVDDAPFASTARDRFNTSHGGAGPPDAPQMASLWVRSHFPETWSVTLEHGIFSRPRLRGGTTLAVPEDHTRRGPIMGRVILRCLRGAE